MTEVTKSPGGVKVLVSRAYGRPTVGPQSYGSWTEDLRFIADLVEERLAPAYHRAKLTLDFTKMEGQSEGPRHAWEWREEVSADDRIAIVNRVTAECYFSGFVVDVDATWNGRDDEAVTVTAVSNAYRLARDVTVYGRYMYDGTGETVRHYSGLRCVFNPGGLPNRGPLLQDLADKGAPGQGVAVFTWDGAPDAEFWTIEEIAIYLLWRYNTDQTWIRNPSEWCSPNVSPITFAAEGMNLLGAVAGAAELAAYDVAETFDALASGNEPPTPLLKIIQRGSGTVRILKRQPPNADRTHPPLDLGETNLFTASIAEATSGCVTRPIAAGGMELVQITVPLYRAWDTTRMVLVDDECPTDPLLNSQYASRYMPSGLDFNLYSNVGRLWDANTDGRYVKAPYLAPVPDMAVLADETTWTWPRMPYVPHQLLTAIFAKTEIPDEEEDATYADNSREAVVEISFDEGTTWYPLEGFRLLPDRLGLYISTANLGEISIRTIEEGSECCDLFTALLADKTLETPKVRMRLTCVVEAPRRTIIQPEWRDSAGTGFATVEWFDRGVVAQVRRIASSSVIGSSVMVADLATDNTGPNLTPVAAAVQDAAEDRSIEANLPMEWLEEPIGLTDRIEEIGGIKYDLRVKVGGVPRSPRIVARTIHFQNWSQTLLLGSDRKAGTVWRPALKTWLPGGLAGWEVPRA